MKVNIFIVTDSTGNRHTITADGNHVDNGYVVFWRVGCDETIMFYRPIAVITELESK
tara:strand:- start:3192 stop:3362 length:171 start_codon:yes stop_codon:yes gene_type:complete